MIVHECEQSQMQIQQSTKSAEWRKKVCVYQQVHCYGNGYNDKTTIQHTQGPTLILLWCVSKTDDSEQVVLYWYDCAWIRTLHVHLQQSTKTQMSSHCRPFNETFSKAMTRTIKQTRHPYTNQWPKTTKIWCVLCINNRRIDLFVWLITNANYRTYNNQPTTKSITTQVACLCLQTRKKGEGKKYFCMMQKKTKYVQNTQYHIL
jgi:hypothetical protein